MADRVPINQWSCFLVLSLRFLSLSFDRFLGFLDRSFVLPLPLQVLPWSLLPPLPFHVGFLPSSIAP